MRYFKENEILNTTKNGTSQFNNINYSDIYMLLVEYGHNELDEDEDIAVCYKGGINTTNYDKDYKPVLITDIFT